MLKTMQHQWVKHTVTPVIVMENEQGQPMLDSQGEPVILVDPEQQNISEEATVYGCGQCGLHISDALNQTCEVFEDGEG